ncbi:hypothetical protein [Lysinibacillus sp. FSL K6-0102]|uniref:hypothetical protein n=1 Tax=Lysinibacillus sp. FSL K6-0102 TaxID=2975290 RepID=UPI0030F9F622
MSNNTFKELGFFAKGMVMIKPDGVENVITNIHDTEGRTYGGCYINTMDAEGLFLELDNVQYLYTDSSWLNFPKDIVCKNANDFVATNEWLN